MIEVARRRSPRTLAVLSVLVGTVFALALAEAGLRLYAGHVRSSDAMEPGLIRYDSRLGWRLTPNWSGRHRHADFDVGYRTNRYGYRGDFDTEGAGRVYAVLGDSFSFGLGVDEGADYLSVLGTLRPGARFLNFSVPGYSTDQELMLLREQVMPFRPDVVWLAVYLGNDLYDNGRPFPRQAAHAKPIMALRDGRLTVGNVPVPAAGKSARYARKEVRWWSRSPCLRARNAVERWLGRFELARLSGLSERGCGAPPSAYRAWMGKRLDLFQAIVTAAKRYTDAAGADLQLVVLPGAALASGSGSAASEIESFLRDEVLATAKGLSIPVFETGEALVDPPPGEPFYHPREGHLTTAGHRAIGEFLHRQLDAATR